MILPGTAIELDTFDWGPGPWWKRSALACIERGRFEAITGRHDKDLYLLRCWLSDPYFLLPDMKWESGESLMLHYFARPDDDGAMHDHPWDFTSECLEGKIIEETPGPHWKPIYGGPVLDLNENERIAGSAASYKATDLHAVTSVQPDTWTLIRTGPRVRNWGFFPPGKPWVPWEEFLATDKAGT